MEFTIRAGAEVDIATTGELNTMHDSLRDQMNGLKRALPRYFTMMAGGSSATSATVPYSLFLGTPPIGFMWDLETVVTCGTDDHTLVAGNVALYAGPVSLGNLRLPALTIPIYQQVGERRIWVQGGQELWASVSGVTNGQAVNVLVSVAEWRQIDVISHGAP